MKKAILLFLSLLVAMQTTSSLAFASSSEDITEQAAFLRQQETSLKQKRKDLEKFDEALQNAHSDRNEAIIEISSAVVTVPVAGYAALVGVMARQLDGNISRNSFIIAGIAVAATVVLEKDGITRIRMSLKDARDAERNIDFALADIEHKQQVVDDLEAKLGLPKGN